MSFRRKYRLLNGSPEEVKYRYSIFAKNYAEIQKHNAKNTSYKQGINRFSDMTWEEFKKGFLMKEIKNPEYTQEGPEVSVESIDWRKKGVISDVKDQGACGSCWAFSTTGSLEAAYAMKGGEKPLFSEQELVDCSRDYDNYGCGGGLMGSAFDYIKDHKIGVESEYSYEAVDGQCRASKTTKRFEIASHRALSPANVNQLSQEIVNQPVSVALEVDGGFQRYTSGIYDGSGGCTDRLNHGVLLVGQGEEDGQNFYIVKNSWGSSWGDNGYIRMTIGTGSGTCGIANGWDEIPTL